MTVPESTVCCLHFDKDNERLADKQTKNIVFQVAYSEPHPALSKRCYSTGNPFRLSVALF
jgi:hypothetical protein